MPVEKHWGDPDRSQPREDTSRGEKIAGISWLCLGAAISLILEVIYLGSRITLGGHSYPFPVTIIIAALFNYVLTKTAKLWTDKVRWVALPLIVWTLLYFIAVAYPALPGTGGTTWFMPDIFGILLMLAGIMGGAWPVMASVGQVDPAPPAKKR